MNFRRYLMALILATACTEAEEPRRATLRLNFTHKIDGEPMHYRSLEYQNAAGNRYEVTNIQWFISALRLYKSSGEYVDVTEPFSHYVDSDIPESFTWSMTGLLTSGTYDSITFVFGLDGAHNGPDQFPNPPESNMAWPLLLGGDQGGYHYMKLNGFWIDNSEVRRPFNLHLGVGQRLDNNGNIIGFIQNWFEVRIPAQIVVGSGGITDVQLIMNVDSWFDSPILYDLNTFGGMIMTNQDAMHALCENGVDAFEVKQTDFGQ